jgi:hypothetical protein
MKQAEDKVAPSSSKHISLSSTLNSSQIFIMPLSLKIKLQEQGTA